MIDMKSGTMEKEWDRDPITIMDSRIEFIFMVNRAQRVLVNSLEMVPLPDHLSG